jgi:Flp pilus assembly pilin Flp
MTKLKSLLRKLHEGEEGAVSLETVLIIGAIALPILIFLIKYGWPTVQGYFNSGMTNLGGASAITSETGGT